MPAYNVKQEFELKIKKKIAKLEIWKKISAFLISSL